jgi:hydrogenase small subunit
MWTCKEVTLSVNLEKYTPMPNQTLSEALRARGIPRRTFLKYCTVTASSLALPVDLRAAFAKALGAAPRPAVIWVSCQECTGCSESLLRAYEPTLETLLLDHFSLDYHNTLQAAAGSAAEAARDSTVEAGGYVLVVDGSIPRRDGGAWSVIGGRSALDIVREAVKGAALVLAVGNCAAYGGLPRANPNPGDAVSVETLMQQGLVVTRPLINLPGCPPVPEVLSGTIAWFLAYGTLPELDAYQRPRVYYGKTVHDCCSRLAHFERGEFAQSFDDEGARKGWCLWQLGCKGPTTFNACSTLQWNQGTSYPMRSGHGCIGCSEPDFWDKVDAGRAGFYAVSLEAPAVGDGSACTAPPSVTIR